MADKEEGGRYMLFCRVLGFFVVLFLVTGCAYGRLHMAGEEFAREHLPYLESGRTTKEEVLLRFGTPSAQFEGERILTYRLILDEHKKLSVVARESDPRTGAFELWGRAEYNLVLVFDERRILIKFSLIAIK
jgi:hypothetical protein